ncbi:MAG: replication initiation protein [Ignavibacteria bacterium]|nr:replication initiation protein [Ignavibacteria bacterium]
MSEKKMEKPLQELKLQENYPIVKANKLIEASYKLSMQEQRIVLSLASRIRKEDKDFHWYKVRISKLAKFLGIEKNKNIYTDVRSTVRALMKKILTIKEDTDDIDLHWIDAAAYGQKGCIKITIHPELKPYLLELNSHFTRYCLKYIINFKSIYSIRIYELLKRYEPYKVMTSELISLKQHLGLKDDEYSFYNNFKEKVLLVAQREILEKTDISFEFEEIKDWKKVVALKFMIKPNSNNKILAKAIDMKAEAEESLKEDAKDHKMDFFEVLPDDTPENVKRMLNKIPEKYQKSKAILAAIQKYLKKNGLDYVERNIAYANKKSNAVNPLSNPGKEANYISYLNKALEKDWGLAHQENRQVKEEDEIKIKEAKEAEERKQRAEAEARKQEEMLFDQAKQYYETLPEETKREIEMAALANMPEALRNQVIRQGPGCKITMDFAIKKVVLERLTKEATSRETKD